MPGIDEIWNKDAEEARMITECSALNHQVGGDYYKNFAIQPVEFVMKNKLSFLAGSIVKRICRFDKPGGKGLQDLEKIKHECDLLAEIEI